MRSTFKLQFYLNESKEKNAILPIMEQVPINGSVAQLRCKQTIAKTMCDAKGNRANGKAKRHETSIWFWITSRLKSIV